MDEGWKARLRKALAAKDMSMKAASLAAGRGETFVRDMLERDRNPGIDKFAAVASVLDITVAELLGERRADEPVIEVPLVGYVGAGAEAHFYDEAQGPFDMVEAPAGSSPDTVAVEIKGVSLGAAFDQWRAFYDDVRSPVTSDLLGHLCVVSLADGRVLIKVLKPSKARGFYHLYSNISEEPITDVAVLWAAKVKTMAPR